MVADLRNDTISACGLMHDSYFLYREGHRLLDIDVQPFGHGQYSRQRMVMVWRGDDDRIKTITFLLQHFAIVEIGTNSRNVSLRLMSPDDGPYLVPMRRIRIAQTDNLLITHVVQDPVSEIQPHAPAAAYEAKSHLVPKCNAPRATSTEARTPYIEQ